MLTRRQAEYFSVLLDLYCSTNCPVPAEEVAQAIKVSKSTAVALLNRLVVKGAVAYEKRGKKYFYRPVRRNA